MSIAIDCNHCHIEFDGTTFMMAFCASHQPKNNVTLQLVYHYNFLGRLMGCTPSVTAHAAHFDAHAKKWKLNIENWVIPAYLNGYNIHLQYVLIDDIDFDFKKWEKTYLVLYSKEQEKKFYKVTKDSESHFKRIAWGSGPYKETPKIETKEAQETLDIQRKIKEKEKEYAEVGKELSILRKQYLERLAFNDLLPSPYAQGKSDSSSSSSKNLR